VPVDGRDGRGRTALLDRLSDLDVEHGPNCGGGDIEVIG